MTKRSSVKKRKRSWKWESFQGRFAFDHVLARAVVLFYP